MSSLMLRNETWGKRQEIDHDLEEVELASSEPYSFRI